MSRANSMRKRCRSSTRRSNAPASRRSVTAAQRSGSSTSRIEVASRKSRISAGWRSSTSVPRKSVMERGVFANSVRKRSGTDSSRSETAAIWTPAAQPSVRAVRSSTSVSFSSIPNSAMTAATSARVSRSSASRTSSSCPCARSRYSASWGSVRLPMITRQLEGRRSMNVVKLGAAAEANWKSSITITTQVHRAPRGRSRSRSRRRRARVPPREASRSRRVHGRATGEQARR